MEEGRHKGPMEEGRHRGPMEEGRHKGPMDHSKEGRHKGPFKCYVTLFFGKLDPHPPPRNVNNIEHYTFVTLFPENMTPPPHPHRCYVTLEWPLRDQWRKVVIRDQWRKVVTATIRAWHNVGPVTEKEQRIKD